MPTTHLLNGVAHNIAHHAQSGLSWLPPHLAEFARRHQTASVSLDLLAGGLSPTVPPPEPLRLAVSGVQEKLQTLVTDAGLEMDDVREVTLTFLFSPDTDDYDSEVRAHLVTRTGRTYEHCIPRIQP